MFCEWNIENKSKEENEDLYGIMNDVTK